MILKTPHELRRSFFGFKKAKFSNIPLITTLPVSGRLRKTVHCYKETLIYDKLYINPPCVITTTFRNDEQLYNEI